MDQRGEITMRAEETRRKRRRSSRVRGTTLEEAEQVEEEDDRVARQVLAQETTVEEVALPLSPFPFYTQTDKLKEREITLLFLMIIIKKEKYYKTTMYRGFFLFLLVDTMYKFNIYLYFSKRKERERQRE